MAERIMHLEPNTLSATLLNPVARTTSVDGSAVDMQAAPEECMIIFTTGVVTDGTYDLVIQDSADGSTDWEEADNLDEGGVAGAGATFTQKVAADDNKTYTLRVRGYRRYIRASLTVGGSPSTGAVLSVHVVGTRKKVY